MKLAQELNLMANETDRVVRKICTTLTTRMYNNAHNGGQETLYAFAAKTKKDIKDGVKSWLTEQGFSVVIDEDGDLTISWDVLRILLPVTLLDRVRERILAASRYEKKSVTMSFSVVEFEELEAAKEGLLYDGYTVDVDDVFQEISVSWE